MYSAASAAYRNKPLCGAVLFSYVISHRENFDSSKSGSNSSEKAVDPYFCSEVYPILLFYQILSRGNKQQLFIFAANFFHHPQKIATQDLFNIAFFIAAAVEFGCNSRELADIL